MSYGEYNLNNLIMNTYYVFIGHCIQNPNRNGALQFVYGRIDPRTKRDCGNFDKNHPSLEFQKRVTTRGKVSYLRELGNNIQKLGSGVILTVCMDNEKNCKVQITYFDKNKYTGHSGDCWVTEDFEDMDDVGLTKQQIENISDKLTSFAYEYEVMLKKRQDYTNYLTKEYLI